MDLELVELLRNVVVDVSSNVGRGNPSRDALWPRYANVLIDFSTGRRPPDDPGRAQHLGGDLTVDAEAVTERFLRIATDSVE
jgi:hypothetical protein